MVLIKIRLAFTGFQASRCNIFLEGVIFGKRGRGRAYNGMYFSYR